MYARVRQWVSQPASGISATMVKVSISLPNNTQITFESEESEVLHEVVGMVLRDLPRDLMRAHSVEIGPPAEQGPPGGAPAEISTGVAGSAATAALTPEPAPATTPVPAQRSRGNGQAAAETPPEFLSEAGRKDFVAFCREANPLGDMRRVVVAAEGASRYFGVDGVNASDLGLLFDMAGWRRPGNFTQTLRNSARSKFGWLERIPGRSGRYAATSLGRSKARPSGG